MQNAAILPQLLAGFWLLLRRGGAQGVLHRHYGDRVELRARRRQRRVRTAPRRRRVSTTAYTELVLQRLLWTPGPD